MKGAGTRHKALIRIMVSRSEVDMNDIKAFYQKKYGVSLCQAILDETKGDYEKILVALVEETNHTFEGLKYYDQKTFYSYLFIV